ncbi:MAG: metallophosphoesterase [Tissierellia bacterium]|nr:metallophosphoesterase [Tissierellia bacterium]
MKLNYIILLIAMTVFLVWQNNDIAVTKQDYINNKIPNSFNGFRILHISDLHNKNFYGRLIYKIKEINPDIIVITGDLIDRRRTNLNVAKEFIGEIVKIAPTYYVSGNHEQLSEHYAELKIILNDYNIVNMDDSYITINKENSEIGLIGIAAPVIIKNESANEFNNNDICVRRKLKDLTNNLKTDFNMLLAHRPEQIHVYEEFDLDLVFSGHAHGGQIRIPFVGAIYSPNQGFFPKYFEGMHKEGSTSIIVSRGLGNSLFPFRIFNPPELIVVELMTNRDEYLNVRFRSEGQINKSVRR